MENAVDWYLVLIRRFTYVNMFVTVRKTTATTAVTRKARFAQHLVLIAVLSPGQQHSLLRRISQAHVPLKKLSASVCSIF